MEREGERERGGSVVRFTRSVREATAPPSLSSSPTGQAQVAGGGCSPNDRPSLSTLPRSSILIYLTLHGARVELAHVDALVVELDVGDM